MSQLTYATASADARSACDAYESTQPVVFADDAFVNGYEAGRAARDAEFARMENAWRGEVERVKREYDREASA